ETQVKDPRLGMVTITDAKLTPDLREATLYYTVYGDEVARADSAEALESAKGVVGGPVGKQAGVRYTPPLAFIADVVPETADRIEALLATAREADAKVQEIASGAAPAGDADPYRVPRVLDDGGVDDEDDDDDGDGDVSDGDVRDDRDVSDVSDDRDGPHGDRVAG
ncbi:MAG: 30S ribosome-binding factor RbfA, partial [Pseudorhodobacter sp.]|nr:30S ribosome-binding factor RbfA [Frankiaceae bacterium]